MELNGKKVEGNGLCFNEDLREVLESLVNLQTKMNKLEG